VPPARRLIVLTITGAAAALCACTNGQPAVNREPHPGSVTASVTNGVQRVRMEAGNDYRFHPSTVTVHPGKVQIVLVNTGTGAPHDWQLPRYPADFVPQIGAHETSSDTFTAPSPGRYQFVCTIHERQGQVGTLIVAPAK
jgi:plastocyanin